MSTRITNVDGDPALSSSAISVGSVKAKTLVFRIFGYLLLAILSILSLFPLAWMLVTSLRDRAGVFGGKLIPDTFTLDAYRFVWSEMSIATYFFNSVKITSITVLAVVALATLSGYAFARLEFAGKQFLFLILLSTLMLPATVLIIPLFLQLSAMNLIDTQAGLILAYIGGSLAFSMYLMRSFFETLPAELADAARIDGDSEFGIFRNIMLPLARPGIATITIFQFMNTWNEFIYAATFLHDPSLRPLQPALFSLIGRYSTNWPALTAGLTVSTMPIVIIFVLMQRQFVSGLTAGALKG